MIRMQIQPSKQICYNYNYVMTKFLSSISRTNLPIKHVINLSQVQNWYMLGLSYRGLPNTTIILNNQIIMVRFQNFESHSLFRMTFIYSSHWFLIDRPSPHFHPHPFFSNTHSITLNIFMKSLSILISAKHIQSEHIIYDLEKYGTHTFVKSA